MNSLLSAPARRPVFTHEQTSRFFFTQLRDDNDDVTGQWRCKVCQKTYKQAEGRGYSNLMQHLRAQHPDYETQLAGAGTDETGSIQSWVSHKAHNRYSWIEWIVEGNLPFVFCEKRETRRNCTLAPVSARTLRENMLRLTATVQQKIAEEMPERFGIIFDGWTHQSEHFLAVFATYKLDGVAHTPLLSIAPVIEEPDADHTAASHRLAIAEVLALFGKRLEQCAVLIGDNCSVNKRLATLMGVPLVGCASHRLNLAVKLLTDPLEDDLDKIQKLMIKLRTLNQAAKLRFRTPLRPVLRQDTRWSSTFAMLHRYFELVPFLDREDDAIVDLLPTAAASKRLKTLLENLKKVESVAKALQAETISLMEVRALFDALVVEFLVFEQYLASNASIVANPHFESAVLKIQAGRQLSRNEKQAVRDFRVAPSRAVGPDAADGFAERARIADQVDQYPLLVNAVPPTSNMVERLFSMARAAIGLERHSLQPIALDAILFLKCNAAYWNVHVVHACSEGNA